MVSSNDDSQQWPVVSSDNRPDVHGQWWSVFSTGWQKRMVICVVHSGPQQAVVHPGKHWEVPLGCPPRPPVWEQLQEGLRVRPRVGGGRQREAESLVITRTRTEPEEMKRMSRVKKTVVSNVTCQVGDLRIVVTVWGSLQGRAEEEEMREK